MNLPESTSLAVGCWPAHQWGAAEWHCSTADVKNRNNIVVDLPQAGFSRSSQREGGAWSVAAWGLSAHPCHCGDSRHTRADLSSMRPNSAGCGLNMNAAMNHNEPGVADVNRVTPMTHRLS